MFNLIPWKRKHEELERTGSLVADPIERSLARMREDFDSLLSRFWSNWPMMEDQWAQSGFGWSFDIEEKDDAYVVRAEAPGFDANDFDVDVRGNYLSIRAEHKEEQEAGSNGRHYRYGRFQRTTALPPGVNTEKISARYRNGVLELELPKSAEARGKRITVQAG